MRLKLEVGKRYIDRSGTVVKIVNYLKDNPHPYISGWEVSYTEDGLYCKGTTSELDLIKEYQEEPKQMNKGYAVTNKDLNNFGRVGIKVDDDSKSLIKLRFADGTHGKYKPTSLAPCTYKEHTFVIEPASKLIKVLEDSGYEISGDGWAEDDEDLLFTSEMLYFCGKEPDTQQFGWRPEWLESEYAIVKFIDESNPRKFLIDLMKYKQSITHEAYLYQRDIDEIENDWSDEECKKVAQYIRSSPAGAWNHCPFCQYNRKGNCSAESDCSKCGYGKRHGVCGVEGSDYQNYICRCNFADKTLKFIRGYGK